MTDLNRLTYIPEQSYRMVQFSSYDRRSRSPGMEGWFSNSDGFGNEPIPGFQQVITTPDDSGSGTYLICDVDGPGAILRLWTAGINGNIRLFLDNMETPVYEGEAEEFFWNTVAKISGINNELTSPDIFRQFDATYFPILFSNRCRIEWIGNIKKIHFYHIGIRLYEKDVIVETFQPDNLTQYSHKLEVLSDNFRKDPFSQGIKHLDAESLNFTIPGNTSMELLKTKGPGAFKLLSFKVTAKDIESALRLNILNIYFDDAEIPQVHAPIGDFFGAAPGLNPYNSYPFSIYSEGSMICSFVMPFKNSARIEIENMSDGTIGISGQVQLNEYQWKDGYSMHFRACWKLNHGLTASNTSIIDMPYILAKGKGRIVGAAAFLYNPSKAVTSWGNWWGEGDEKIFIDDEPFPSFFGTGSEDYFNYSWSAEHFFSFPYCGQPRNDGPGNRGYVSNFRWHILDDLFFNKSIAFYMELFHHGVVKNFSYGRIIYAYTLPGYFDDSVPISKLDIETIPYLEWTPLAYLGSAGYTFIQAENIIVNPPYPEIVNGKLWSEGKILMWKPENENDELKFIISKPERGESGIGMTLAHIPQGGEFMVLLNGEKVLFNQEEIINSSDLSRTFLKNYLSKASFKSGDNEITLINKSKDPEKTIGVDFFWLKND